MKKTSKEPAETEDPKRRRLLEAALATFLRFGYRKTSMEDVSRAAQVSRQGLYLHFPNKEELLRSTVAFWVESSLEAAAAAFAAEGTLQERLAGAFGAWHGRLAGSLRGGFADLRDATEHVFRQIHQDGREAFLTMVLKAMRASDLPAAYKDTGIGLRDLAETLFSTAEGLMQEFNSREEFSRRFAVAVRIVCSPLSIRR